MLLIKRAMNRYILLLMVIVVFLPTNANPPFNHYLQPTGAEGTNVAHEEFLTNRRKAKLTKYQNKTNKGYASYVNRIQQENQAYLDHNPQNEKVRLKITKRCVLEQMKNPILCGVGFFFSLVEATSQNNCGQIFGDRYPSTFRQPSCSKTKPSSHSASRWVFCIPGPQQYYERDPSRSYWR